MKKIWAFICGIILVGLLAILVISTNIKNESTNIQNKNGNIDFENTMNDSNSSSSNELVLNYNDSHLFEDVLNSSQECEW